MPIARVRGPGHPDQVCDLVAVAIVEEYARRDPASRLHLRVMGGHGAMFVTGEVSSTADFDVSSVVRRVVGASGVQAEIEPFIALEPMAPAWAAEYGAREGAHVVAYATNETVERFPKQCVLARKVAQLIEKKRLEDEDWFWLDADYEILVERVNEKYVTVLRVGHADAKPIAEVRNLIQHLLSSAGVPGPIRINPAGEETRIGLQNRVGSSGRLGSVDGSSSLLPSSPSGVGLHVTHPLNAGSWLARAIAKECVGRNLGEAVQVSVSWLPLESRAHQIRIRNERGDDLAQAIDQVRFDLRQLPESYKKGGYLTQALQAHYQPVELPWEK
jgi:S-adenosylmethionine synthetase